jgi:hypothetical protein
MYKKPQKNQHQTRSRLPLQTRELTLSATVELDRYGLVHVLVQIKDVLLLALATVFGAGSTTTSTASVTTTATSTTSTTTATGSEVAAFRHLIVLFCECFEWYVLLGRCVVAVVRASPA